MGRQDYADGSRPESGSPRLDQRKMNGTRNGRKTCKLWHVKEKELRTQDFKSENPFFKSITTLRQKSRNESQIQVEDLFFRQHLDFGTKSRKSETEFK